MADRIILTLHIRVPDLDDVPDLLREAAKVAEDDGMESRAIQVVGADYSWRLERHDERHELSERAAAILGAAAIGSPLGDLAVALSEVERLREARDRLAALLACERGDQSAAPPGWEWDCWEWYRDHAAGDVTVLRFAREWVAEGRRLPCSITAPTALEAMEAADAALARQEDSGHG